MTRLPGISRYFTCKEVAKQQPFSGRFSDLVRPRQDLVRPLLEQLEGTVAFALFMARFQVQISPFLPSKPSAKIRALRWMPGVPESRIGDIQIDR